MKFRKTIALTTCLLSCSFAFATQNYIQDPQLTEYRSNKGKSDVWISHEKSSQGLGDVGSSKDSAFGEEGSSRIRFKRDVSNHDFTATPGLSQIITGLPKNTNMTYSLYYCDKKGSKSQTSLHYGVRKVVKDNLLQGDILAENKVHNKELTDAPKGKKKKCFRQVSVDFNTGNNTQVEVFSLIEVDTSRTPDLSKELEVRVDEFSLTKK